MRNKMTKMMMVAASVLTLSACSEVQLASHLTKKVFVSGLSKNKGTYKVGAPYTIKGRKYYPQEDFHLVQKGVASWYGPGFHGKKTANGEVYDQYEMTAAHKTLQLPSMVKVTNLQNGRSIVVRVNDRGPYAHGRIIDLSKRAAQSLDMIKSGTAKVKVEVMTEESIAIAEMAKSGMNTSNMELADIRAYMRKNGVTQTRKVVAVKKTPPPPAPQKQIVKKTVKQPVQQVAYMQNDAQMLPESLIPAEITASELYQTPASSSGAGYRGVSVKPKAAQPKDASYVQNLQFLNKQPKSASSKQAVTGKKIFVQAGSFGVESNARNLERQYEGKSPVQIDRVDSNGRQLFRVRLGPIADQQTADLLLTEIQAQGMPSARIVID